MPAHARSPGMLRAIAAFKLFKGLALVLAGLGAIKLVAVGPGSVVARVVEWLNLSGNARLADTLLERLFSANPRKLEALGLGSFLYGALFLVEGVGLWLQKRWAEYVTIVTTAGFIPFEVVALVKHFDVERVVVLVINAAIVVYLVWRVRAEKRHPESGRRAPAARLARSPA